MIQSIAFIRKFRALRIPKTKTFQHRSFFGFLLLCLSSFVCAEVSLHLDKDKVQQGQTFNLTLKIEGNQINAMPNFMPLQKDFSIEGTQSAVNYSVINGHISSVSEWTLLLSARRSGKLTIPPLQVGNEKTEPLTIEITKEAPTTTESPTTSEPGTKEPDSVNQSQKNIQLLTEISDKTPYVNQQVIYTVKLLNSSRLLDANYQPPQVENALFVPTGNDRRYQINENGHIYTVQEQQFALFPQKSGYLKIKPPSFHALVYDFTPKRMSVEAKPTTLNVKPIPPNFSGKTWLPAKQITLSENYDKSTGSLTEGSTLVRTVALQAVAVPAELLPVLDFGNSDQFSVYPEKPVASTQFKQQDIVGRATVKATYLFNKAGRVTVPPLTLTWFNTITEKEETSTLPGFTIEVKPSSTSSSKAPESPAVPKPISSPSTANQQEILQKNNLSNDKPETKLAWWLALGFALAWLITMAAWAWQRHRRPAFTVQTKNQILQELQEACFNNRAEEARSALLKWGRLLRPELRILNLNDLERLINDEALQEQINRLSQFLYHQQTDNKEWQGRPLWNAFVNYKGQRKNGAANSNPLPPLNKI